jgi:hypothetical protein
MIEFIIFITILTGIIITIVIIKTRKTKKGNPPTKINPPDVVKNNQNFILPQEFKVGLVKQSPMVYMNNCSPNVLYPINGLGPDYGWKMPKNCRCTEFVQAP